MTLISSLERGGGQQIVLSGVCFLITQPFFNICDSPREIQAYGGGHLAWISLGLSHI